MGYTSSQQGFTLIETMVAISVLVIALSAPLTLASQSLFASVYAKDQVTASYLAQEAIEVVREKRDNNFLNIINGASGVSWLDSIPQGEYFSVDVAQDSIVACGTSCKSTALNNNGAFYTYQSGTATRFSREVFVSVFPGGDEARVTATVYWTTGAFREQSVVVEEHIFNWVPTP